MTRRSTSTTCQSPTSRHCGTGRIFAAYGVSRFLYYYRLVGVVLFELTQLRWVLLVFPEHVRVLLRLLRGRPDPVGSPTHEPRPADRRGGVHLDLHQAAPGMVDPRRTARHDRLHQGRGVRRPRRKQLGRGRRGEPDGGAGGGDPGGAARRAGVVAVDSAPAAGRPTVHPRRGFPAACRRQGCDSPAARPHGRDLPRSRADREDRARLPSSA